MPGVNGNDDNRWYFGKADWITKAMKKWLYWPVCALCSNTFFLTLNLVFMKKLIWAFVPIMALMLACEKEAMNGNMPGTEKKFGAVDNGVKVPMKAVLYGIPTAVNTACVPGQQIPSSMMIGGDGTHSGEVQLDKSWWTATSCTFDMDKMMITEVGDGRMTGDNGDYYNIHATVYTYVNSMTFEGDVEIMGGTGKYKDCTGSVKMLNGYFTQEGMLKWYGEGYIIFAK
jgi:hypothetical protein